MRLVGQLRLVAVLAALLLAQAEGADDKRAVTLDGEVRTLRGKVAGLEARLAALERAVKVSGGSLELASAGGLVIKAGSTVAIQGGSAVTIQGGGAVTIKGGGTVDLRGAALHLNGGGRPVARVGDPVVVQGSQGQSTGQITAGSPTVLVQ